MNNLLQIAIQASLQADKAIMEIYATNDFDIESKSDDSPLTKAD
jgi:3'(2'), 5'-bisphosphate nucleotidase